MIITHPEIQSVPIEVSVAGDNIIVPANTTDRIRVLGLMLSASGIVTSTLKSAGGSKLIGSIAMTAQSGFALNYAPPGWAETAANEALVLNLDTNVAVAGVLIYDLVHY